MANKSRLRYIEAKAYKHFDDKDFPQFPTPVTVTMDREFNTETEEWEIYVTMTMNGQTITLTVAQWRKIETFLKHAETFMESV